MAATEIRRSTVAALLHLGLRASSSWEETLEDVLRIDADLLGVRRTSYWTLRDEPQSIVCELGYSRGPSGSVLERGLVLYERDCAAYFEEVTRVQALAIDDVAGDPRVAGLEGYLRHHRIGALLDVPVFARGRHVGVLCHEHVGSPRTWSDRDKEFVVAVSHAVAAALESRACSEAEAHEREAVFLADTAAALAESFPTTNVPEVAVSRAVESLGDAAVVFETVDGHVQLRAATDRRPGNEHLVDELTSRYPCSTEEPGLGPLVLREAQSVLLPNLHAERLELPDEELRILKALDLRTAMAVPLRIRGRVIGAMVLAREAGAYDSGDLRLADSFVHEVAVALDNVRMYERTRDAVRARDEFLRLASHELRTPLSVLSLSARELAELPDAHVSEAAKRLSAAIGRQADRLGRLGSRILDASQIGNGGLSIEPERIDLALLVRDVGNLFASNVEQAGGELVVEADGAVWGKWDPIRIEQLLNNLLDNALKFGRGRSIDLTLEAHEDVVTLCVRDHGIGIPPSSLDEVFGRYRRAVDPRAFSGFGLGLHIVREIAKAHGGTVSATNAEGGGVVFTVSLPRDPPARGGTEAA